MAKSRQLKNNGGEICYARQKTVIGVVIVMAAYGAMQLARKISAAQSIS